MKNVNKKMNQQSEIRILKIANCPTVSGKSTLTYQVGCTSDQVIHLRIYANTAAGFFSQEWVPWPTIEDVLSHGGDPFTSTILKPLFQGQSQNNSGFLLAVLLQEGVVTRAKGKSRGYRKLDSARFLTGVQRLIESDVSLNADDKPSEKSVRKPKAKKTAVTESVVETA